MFAGTIDKRLAIVIALGLIGALLFIGLRLQNEIREKLEFSTSLATAHSEGTLSANLLQDAEAQIDEHSATLIAISTENSSLATRLESWQVSANEAQSELEDLEEKNDCQDITSFESTYIGNPTVAEDLEDWIGVNFESVDGKEWDVIYNNTKLAIHDLYGEFGYKFIVYFDEPEFPYTEGVFFVNRQCWIDR